MRTTHREQFESALRMAPLLRGIAREMDERLEHLDRLESELEALTPDLDRDSMRQIDAQISTHRRELRRAEKELERLGWTLDALAPLELSLRSLEGSGNDVVWKPEDTGFYQLHPDRTE